MKAAEKNLLRAVRDRLRLPQDSPNFGGGYEETECDVEYDLMAPATVPDVYVAVMAGSVSPGPRHNASGGVNDLVYSVRVGLLKRIRNVPRDRRRDAFAMNTGALCDDIDRIYQTVDWRYDVINLANSLIEAETQSIEGFIEPLRFLGQMGPPRIVGGEYFGGGEKDVAMVREIPFGGARRITTKA